MALIGVSRPIGYSRYRADSREFGAWEGWTRALHRVLRQESRGKELAEETQVSQIGITSVHSIDKCGETRMDTPANNRRSSDKSQTASATLKIVALYALFSCLWILISDEAVDWLFDDPRSVIVASTLKGWLFVAATSLMLHRLIRNLVEQARDSAQREQEVLRKSEENFRSFFEKNSSMMWLVDPATGQIIDANASALAFYGLSKAQITRLRIGDINVLPRDQLAAAMSRAANSESNAFVFPHRVASGEVRNVEVYTTMIEREGRSLVLSIIHDITDRKRAEDALRESEERLRLALGAANQGWFDANLISGTITVGPEYARMLGYEPDEFLSSVSIAPTRAHPDDREMVTAFFASSVDDGAPRTMEFRRQTKSGSWLWIRSVGKVIERDSDNLACRMIGISTDITERKQMEEHIHQLAFFDSLTKLANRRLFEDRLNQAMAVSRRTGYYCTVMFADLDNFKPLNDRHGHEVGDLLLVEVADRLRKCVREIDTVARFGGDEFVIMISELDTDKSESARQAQIVAEKIRAALAVPYVLQVPNPENGEETVEHRCSVSIGVTLFANHEATPAKILKVADMAMYRAKDAGRNVIRFLDLNEQVTMPHDLACSLETSVPRAEE